MRQVNFLEIDLTRLEAQQTYGNVYYIITVYLFYILSLLYAFDLIKLTCFLFCVLSMFLIRSVTSDECLAPGAERLEQFVSTCRRSLSRIADRFQKAYLHQGWSRSSSEPVLSWRK